jgi:hypothetical protein
MHQIPVHPNSRKRSARTSTEKINEVIHVAGKFNNSDIFKYLRMFGYPIKKEDTYFEHAYIRLIAL